LIVLKQQQTGQTVVQITREISKATFYNRTAAAVRL
jgi:hypothetical protein